MRVPMMQGLPLRTPGVQVIRSVLALTIQAPMDGHSDSSRGERLHHHRPLQEIKSRVTARAFAAVMDPTQGPAVREVLARLTVVLDETSPDGLI